VRVGLRLPLTRRARSPFIRAVVATTTDSTKPRSPLGLIFLTILIDMIGFGIVIPVLPVYAEGSRFGATPTQLSLLVGIYSLLQLIFSPVLGRLSDRIGRKPVLTVSILGTAIGFFVTGAAGAYWMLLLGRIIDGVSGGNIATGMACIADVTTKENRSKSMGLIGAAFGVGFMIGPALGGVLGKISPASAFLRRGRTGAGQLRARRGTPARDAHPGGAGARPSSRQHRRSLLARPLRPHLRHPRQPVCLGHRFFHHDLALRALLRKAFRLRHCAHRLDPFLRRLPRCRHARRRACGGCSSGRSRSSSRSSAPGFSRSACIFSRPPRRASAC